MLGKCKIYSICRVCKNSKCANLENMRNMQRCKIFKIYKLCRKCKIWKVCKTCKTKPTKPNIPNLSNQTYRTKPTKSNPPNKTYTTNINKPTWISFYWFPVTSWAYQRRRRTLCRSRVRSWEDLALAGKRLADIQALAKKESLSTTAAIFLYSSESRKWIWRSQKLPHVH